jgi:outer membrane protein OmpA-like peptidoglycan-associated protein
MADIFFQLDSFDISYDQMKTIDSLDVFNKELELIGLSDYIGNDEYNINLSKNRAKEVKDILLQKGASKVHINSGLQSSLIGSDFRKVIILGL